MNKVKKLVSILIITVLVLSMLSFTAFADSDSITIKFNVGSSSVQANGSYYTFAGTYFSENTAFTSADVFVRILGAELTKRDNASYNFSYNNASIDFSIGKRDCKANDEGTNLPAAPQLKNGTVFVPFKFFAEKFGASVSYNSSSNMVTAYFADDGALKDLSFLTDSIKKSRVGDSYYNWSMNIPRGSRVSGGTFNSKYVSIENANRNIALDIKIADANSETLSSYYDKVLEDPSTYLEGYSIADSRLVKDARDPYMEFIYTGTSSEPIVHRIYINSKYIYNVILYYYGEEGTDDITGSQYYKTMLDSFATSFDKSQNIQDLTKIQHGKAIYNNYVQFPNGKKYYAWKASIPPVWDVIPYASDDNPLSTKIGAGNNEYVAVAMDKSNGKNIALAGEQRKDFLNSNMNPQIYKFISAGTTDISGIKTYRIVYELTLGKKTYTYDEALTSMGGIIYNLTLKTPTDKYKDNKLVFDDILNSFKPVDKFTSAFNKDLDNYFSQLAKNKVGKYDYPTLFENKEYKWSANLPGSWSKTGSQSSDFISFLDKNTGLSVAVETVEKDSDNASESDEDKFYFMSSILNNEGITLKDTSNSSDKGNVKTYTYRWEDEENETFADVKFSVLENSKYYYCYFSVIPDEFKTQSNTETLNRIWSSFKIVD